MKSYPVSVPRTFYRGSNPRQMRKMHDYNRIAAHVEVYINADLEKQPEDSITQYMSGFVALELGENADLVRDVIFGIDCGQNGVTIVKGNFERAMRRLSTPPETRVSAS